MSLKLDLGCGTTPAPGFVGVDAKLGAEVYPLAYPDGSAEVIRASHVLEHFSHTQIGSVLADWVRVLAPGGRLQIAVPDFEAIARAYLDGQPLPVQGYVMGGHVDARDHHGAIFDAEALAEAMTAAGLLALRPWVSEQTDCAALPISLNLEGTKPPERWPHVRAVISVPRLGWNDMWGCAMDACGRLGIRLVKHTGAFWEQCLTRGLDEALQAEPDYLLTLDYDTVFDHRDLQTLILCAERNPQAGAIAALQAHRSKPTPLMTMADADGNNATQVERALFGQELVPARTAHFGCTLIRTAALRAVPRPWFWGRPDATGEWSEARTDPDIAFWRAFEAAGQRLYVAARVPVGHLEVMIRWPNRDLAPVHQHPSDYHRDGRPEDAWR